MARASLHPAAESLNDCTRVHCGSPLPYIALGGVVVLFVLALLYALWATRKGKRGPFR